MTISHELRTPLAQILLYSETLALDRVRGDDAKRAALYTQADQIAFNDAPMIFLFFYKDLFAVQPWIKGFIVPAVFNAQRWTDVSILKK